MADSLAWYEELRERYRPEPIRVLLIGESPPDPGDAERRFFYAPALSRHDNLYRGVAEALYGGTRGFSVKDKAGNLGRLKGDGFWLIDAVEHPINKASRSVRKRDIEKAADGLVARCLELAPEVGVIICHGVVFQVAGDRLRPAGIRLLHSQPIPFPLGNWREEFVRGFREALSGQQR